MELNNCGRRGAAAALGLVTLAAALINNAQAADGTTLPPPLFSPAGGLFTNATVSVTLTGATSEIRYTLDGTTPTTTSLLYTAVLTLSNSCHLQARVFSTSAPPGGVAAGTFTLLDTHVAGFTSTLPLVLLQTFGQPIEMEKRTLASLRVIDVPTNGPATLLGPENFDGRAAIKHRGFTSLRYPKISMSVETLDQRGDETEPGLLGLPQDSDWVLYAPYPDKSLLRDVLAYELFRQMGRYAPRTRFVEVFLCSDTNRLSLAHYAGVYVLVEKVKRGDHRVALQKLGTNDVTEPAITGGYIFKKDHLSEVETNGAPPARAAAGDRSSRIGYPTAPGGFPADPAAFLPPFVEVLTNELITSFTNIVPATNVVALTNLTAFTNVVAATTIATLTNITWLTNALPYTNYSVHHHVQWTTNIASVTNLAALTNLVSIPNVAPFPGAAAFTNVVTFTNVATFTNIAAVTNTTPVTNALLATVVVAFTNLTPVTNVAALTNITTATHLEFTYLPGLATNVTHQTNVLILTNSLATLAALAASNALAGVTNPNALPSSLVRLMETGQGFVTPRTNGFFYAEPKAGRILPAQQAWLSNYVSRLEQALHGPDFRNPTNGYPAFLEPDSFIDQHLFVEATKNIDGFRFSTFYTKDRGGRLKMEPIWDWNLSFGNARGKQGTEYEHWYWPQLDDRQYSWFRRLFEDPDFGQRYVDRWTDLRATVFATSNLWSRIDALAAVLREPAARNFARWPILDTPVATEPVVGKTYEDQIVHLKTWASNRLAWVHAQFLAPPGLHPAVAEAAFGATLAFTSAVGRVYYTTDGGDPRLDGGGIAPTARTNDTPLVVTNTVRLFARVQVDGRWSSPWRTVVQMRPVGSGAVTPAGPNAGGVVSAAPADEGLPDDLFTQASVRQVRIDVPPPAMEVLRAFTFRREAPLAEKPQVLCTVHEGGRTWTNVAMQLKGSLGSFRPVDGKPAFTLNFSKHAPGQRFHGLEKISLNNSAQDPSRCSEKLWRELYTRGGVPVPRAGYITAELNGRPLGLFVLLEGWDRPFLSRHFPDARGPLYEGPFLTDVDQPMRVSYGKPPDAGLSPTSLVAAAREPDPAKRHARLASLVDLDRFTRLLALDMLAWNGDGYALHANNYRIFHDRTQERLVFLPHGLDQTSYLTDAPVLAGGDGLVATAVLSLPECRRQVLDRIREFRQTLVQLGSIQQRAQDWIALLAPVWARETNAPDALTSAAHAQLVNEFIQRVSDRLASIDEQIAGITHLTPLRVQQALALQTCSWTNRVNTGAPAFVPAYTTASLGVRNATDAGGAWVTRLWLEEGRYRLQGRLRAAPATPGGTHQISAGLRVRSERKRSLGLDWGWDSRRRAEYRPGGETGNLVHQPLPPNAGTNWTDLTCELDLRQPVADLEISCEAAGTGETWFDLPSLQLTRLTDPGR